MPSTAPPEAQIIARCQLHRPQGIASPYVAAVAPIGDGQAVRCRCGEPALIWLTDASWRLYLGGMRNFRPRTMTVVIRVGENMIVRPKQ
jgi:hypothetical protein